MSLVRNFGGNVEFEPRRIIRPTSEEELIEILRGSEHDRIRVSGRLHSWSRICETDGLLIDTSRLNTIEIADDQSFAIVGAGCQVKHLLRELDQHGLTLPSVGLISEQAIAGAISTATHGSGKQALSHFVRAVRLVTVGLDGQVEAHRIEEGDVLRAAQCSIGMLGVIVSVEIEIRQQYHVEEHFREYRDLNEVLEAEADFPLQQFFVLPWKWTYLTQHRRESVRPKSLLRWLHHVYWFVAIDVMLIVTIMLVLRTQLTTLIRFLYRFILPWFVIRRLRTVDKSQRMLVMENELFRHVEMEVFVRRSRLEEMLQLVRDVVEHAAGENKLNKTWIERLSNETRTDLERQQRKYTHHFPITIRKVKPDNSLVSQTSGGDESWYAVSLISYETLNRLNAFRTFIQVVAELSVEHLDARLHWGKICPLPFAELKQTYPEWPRFEEIVEQFDPNGRFKIQSR